MTRLNRLSHTMLKTILFLFAGLLCAQTAHAAPAGLTFQGRLVNNSQSVEGASVGLTIKVTSPSAPECLLYEETHTLNMTNSDGIFTVKIGGGTRTVNDEGLSLTEIFSNSGTAINNLACTGGVVTSYAPGSTDSRNVYVTFVDGSDTVAFSSPYVIQSVPYALEAERLAGKSSTDFLQVTTDTTQTKLNNIMVPATYTELLALLNGTSSQFLTPSGANFTPTSAVNFNSQNITNASGISLNGSAARSIAMDRQSTSNTAGNQLSINASGATSGATDKNGGNLILSGGTSTGTGSSNIEFKTSTAGGAGTTDNAPSTKMTILGNGNVGIGTTSPSSNLHVAAAVSAAVTINATSSGSTSASLIFKHDNGGTPYSGSIVSSWWGYGMTFTTPRDITQGGFHFTGQNGTEAMHIDTATSGVAVGSSYANTTTSAPANGLIVQGNVGIGTTTPSAKLHIKGGQTAYEDTFGNPPTLVGIPSGGDDFEISSTYGGTDFILKTTNTERVRILAGGNVGIGTTIPGQPLDVNGVIRSSGSGGLEIVEGGAPRIRVALDTATAGYSTIVNSYGNSSNPGIVVGTSRTDGVAFQVATGVPLTSGLPSSNGTPVFHVGGNGNVGVGTTAPSANLDVYGTTKFSTDVFSYVSVTPGGGNGNVSVIKQSTNSPRNGGDLAIQVDWSNQGGNFMINTNGANERLRVTTAGNVGIGTTSPQSTLQVNGYVQLALTSGAPAATDCDAAAERGRMKVDNAAGLLYICMDSGWVSK